MNGKETNNKKTCLICKQKGEIIGSQIWYPPFENSFINYYTNQFTNKLEQITKNNDGSITSETLHLECQKNFETEKNWWELKKLRTELQNKKCDICQEFLLKNEQVYAKYHVIWKNEEEIKNLKKDENFIYKVVCWKCLDANQYLLIGRKWWETMINLGETLILDKDRNRINHTKT